MCTNKCEICTARTTLATWPNRGETARETNNRTIMYSSFIVRDDIIAPTFRLCRDNCTISTRFTGNR